MKLTKHYKASEYLFLLAIIVLALLLGTYFSFYALFKDAIETKINRYSKNHTNSVNYYEGMSSKECNSLTSCMSSNNKYLVYSPNASCPPGYNKN